MVNDDDWHARDRGAAGVCGAAMTKYTTIVKGTVTGIVQGDGAQVVIQDGKVITPHGLFNRLVKYPNCEELVPDAAYCIECGRPLK